MQNTSAAYFAIILTWGVCVPATAFAQNAAPRDLTQASLEDLMNIKVTSVSRKEQKLSETGGAVFVITQDDIQRSGAVNLPDVLRMAPGVNVARVDANTWAVTIRGFNSRYSDKILVLIDGRSVYSPGFSGVNWDEIDVPLEDIERIEVVRGPGGSVWGANAMNGVINIITMSSKATRGGLVVAGAGSSESGGLAQYGGKAGTLGTWRAFGRYTNTDSSVNPAGGPAADGWHSFHEGLRTDLELSPRDTLMVQGDLYRSAEGQTLTAVLARVPAVATFNDPITVSNGDLQARWSHTLRNGSEMGLNLYYNRVDRLDQGVTESSNSFDIDFQHHLKLNSHNDLVWGLGYRVTNDNLTSGYAVSFAMPQRTDNLYSAFVQDEIGLGKFAHFTIGTKLEHNAYTGFEYEPGAQLVFTPTSRQTLWFSASQAIRQPSRQDTDLVFNAALVPLQGGNYGIVEFLGSKNVLAEQLRDYEIGYRAQVTRRFSLDVAVFRGYYQRLQTSETGTPYFDNTVGAAHFVLPEYLDDDGRARTYGGEVFATWNVSSRWRLSPGYSLLHMSALNIGGIVGYSPEHQIHFRSTFELRRNLDWDTSLYFIGQLSGQQVPGYTRVDTQLRWRVLESVEFAVTGQNLLTARHTEFGDAYVIDHTQVLRSVLGKVTWRF